MDNITEKLSLQDFPAICIIIGRLRFFEVPFNTNIVHNINTMEHLEPNQFDNLLSSKEKALVMFYADWCPFCQRFKPIFESAISTSTSYTLYESKVNDDDNPLWDRFSIFAVPTLLAFDKGKIISRRDAKMGVGLNQSDLDSMLKEI